ncbi:hypothetical protein CC78DRAFT_574948 [Lojkania enalia]|uniref:Uncharacterized protein n=1 Tax=Lojkania enalia TaxID=147567 RepID=A0A9P4NA31_9PLEO|nr:hypothetical protein CC78DRAFT_574948 [Didymosphaeria enalia]
MEEAMRTVRRKISEMNGPRNSIDNCELSLDILPTFKANPNIYLLTEAQAEKEPHHWILLLAYEGYAEEVYQVTGDAECRYYDQIPVANPVASNTFLKAITLAEDVDDTAPNRIKSHTKSEEPGHAPYRRSVTDNCQGWPLRVIVKLVRRELIETQIRRSQEEATAGSAVYPCSE